MLKDHNEDSQQAILNLTIHAGGIAEELKRCKAELSERKATQEQFKLKERQLAQMHTRLDVSEDRVEYLTNEIRGLQDMAEGEDKLQDSVDELTKQSNELYDDTVELRKKLRVSEESNNRLVQLNETRYSQVVRLLQENEKLMRSRGRYRSLYNGLKG